MLQQEMRGIGTVESRRRRSRRSSYPAGMRAPTTGSSTRYPRARPPAVCMEFQASKPGAAPRARARDRRSPGTRPRRPHRRLPRQAGPPRASRRRHLRQARGRPPRSRRIPPRSRRARCQGQCGILADAHLRRSLRCVFRRSPYRSSFSSASTRHDSPIATSRPSRESAIYPVRSLAREQFATPGPCSMGCTLVGSVDSAMFTTREPSEVSCRVETNAAFGADRGLSVPGGLRPGQDPPRRRRSFLGRTQDSCTHFAEPARCPPLHSRGITRDHIGQRGIT